MATITLDRLTKTFGNHNAVDGINLHVANGEFISLLGPSGCGKTTTLRMLAGFSNPDDGQILIDDKVVSSRQKVVPPEKRNMSMIFQSYAIWPHKTVFENVAFGLQLRKVSKEDLRQRVLKALEVVRLTKLADRYPAQLSGGQQQRVALARAVVIEPTILLMDEPLSNLDASLREEMRSEVRQLHDELGITTVYVTHDQGEALVTSDRIVVMLDGSIQQVASPEEIYENPATEFVARFIGKCNIIAATVLRAGQVEFEGLRVVSNSYAPGTADGPGDKVMLTIRPHTVKMEAATGQPDATNCLRGRIERQVYLGEYRDYSVRLDGTSIKLSVITPPSQHHASGDEVFLTLPPQCCRLVPPTRALADEQEKLMAVGAAKG